MDQVAIAEGIGGVVVGHDGSATGSTSAQNMGLVNVRQKYIQGIDKSLETSEAAFLGTGFGVVPNNTLGSGVPVSGSVACTRRYQVNLALGLLTQDKLLPVKFMASQLAIEFTLEQPSNCIFVPTPGYTPASGATPTYGVTNFNLIPEILEFDSSYDAMFLKGLQDGGV